VNDQTDQQLLRDYAERRSEAAFAELVRRHVDLVYSAAWRMVRDVHLAEDVTQRAFAALAQNARRLTERLVLSGWLHRTAQHLAANAVRSEVRRRIREQEAAAMNELLATGPDISWEQIAPHLDAALGELNAADRDAVLLRYFERKSAHEMAQTLGVSDETAQKRVSRAVERLREFFAKHGVTVGASGLTVALSANAVQAAPVGLMATISTAVLTGTAIHTSTAIAMTTLQKAAIAATLAIVAGTGIYEARQASQLRDQVESLRQQQAPLTEQIQQLQRERDDATNRLAAVNDENARFKSGQYLTELLKLRSQVGLLQQSALNNLPTNSAFSVLASMMNDPAQKKLDQIQAREAAKDKYSSLVKTLQLSPEDTERFFDLISGNETSKKDMIAALISGNLDTATAQQQRDAAKTEMESQLKTLLGAPGYAQYDQFNRDSFAEDRVNALNRELGSNGFNDEQRKQIKAVFAATSPIPLEDIDAFRSRESMDALFQQWTDQFRSELQQAAQFLTPEQSAAAFTCQSNLFNRIQMQIDLSQQLLDKLTRQKAQ
jgi:RNA polymerase sigma factor (sigma-70 family)